MASISASAQPTGSTRRQLKPPGRRRSRRARPRRPAGRGVVERRGGMVLRPSVPRSRPTTTCGSPTPAACRSGPSSCRAPSAARRGRRPSRRRSRAPPRSRQRRGSPVPWRPCRRSGAASRSRRPGSGRRRLATGPGRSAARRRRSRPVPHAKQVGNGWRRAGVRRLGCPRPRPAPARPAVPAAVDDLGPRRRPRRVAGRRRHRDVERGNWQVERGACQLRSGERRGAVPGQRHPSIAGSPVHPVGGQDQRGQRTGASSRRCRDDRRAAEPRAVTES